MPITKPPYPAQFRQQMVELVQAGRKSGDLAKKFGCHITSILSWVRKAQPTSAAASPTDSGPLSAVERQELMELRRKYHQVQMERDILARRPGLPTTATRRSRRLRAD
ncbi:MAG: transposase [Polaromonas sp.]|uniref:transposase n=1 Tax=Polaromonas sp. TaxID=1869339 RepID=UPI002730D82E|nr:transposase [Polaromonas sp.]MDP2451376.1 transposase [Polaromonas sp.]MDP3827552.1 transposase [Polaromonas sp.]